MRKETNRTKSICKLERKEMEMKITIKKLEGNRVPNDNNEKSNSSISDDSSADDAAGTNHNHPALTRQANGKRKIKRGEMKQEWTGWKTGKTVTFGEGTKFTAIERKKVAKVRSVHIKVSN